MNDFEKTALDVIGLDDSEEISYFFKEEKLIVLIKNWQLKIIEIIFNNVIFFLDWALERYISELYFKKSGMTSVGDSLTNYVAKSLNSNISLAQYKLYQFVTSRGKPCMEIGCTDFQFQIYKDESEYKFAKINNDRQTNE